RKTAQLAGAAVAQLIAAGQREVAQLDLAAVEQGAARSLGFQAQVECDRDTVFEGIADRPVQAAIEIQLQARALGGSDHARLTHDQRTRRLFAPRLAARQQAGRAKQTNAVFPEAHNRSRPSPCCRGDSAALTRLYARSVRCVEPPWQPRSLRARRRPRIASP